MSFPAYPNYKDSGVEWLGQVPAHWTVERLTHLYREAAEPGEDHLPILSVSIHSGVSDEEASPDDGDRKVTRSDDRTKYKKVLPGDLVYNMMRAWQGGFGAVQVPGMVSPAYVVARPRGDASSRYIELLLRTPGAVEEMRRLSRGITDFRLRLYWDEFKNIRVALPSAAECEAILAFLDRETSKIDALIEEQRRLITLLKEKRQAVISHAIIKGRDPHAPLKESGIEWLGSVPSHWSISRLKFHTALLTSGSRGWGDFYADEGPVFVRIGNMTRDTIELDLRDIQRVAVPADAEGARTKLQPYDLLFSITAYLGSVAVVPEGLGDAYVSQHVALCRLSEGAPDARWLGYLALSEVGRTHFDLQAYGGTKIQLSLSDIATLPVLVPPSGEQCEILDWLETELKKHRSLETEAADAIALLIERREALVSAAVTGKIDVRQPAKILAFPIDRARARRFVATEIIERLAHQPTFGRTKLQKVAYLAEAHANIIELAGCYIRMPFGPLDQPMMDEIEAIGSDDGIAIDDKRDGSMVRYRVTGTKGSHTADLRNWLGEERFAKLDHLIKVLSGLKTHSAEAIATLYAVWNDALIEGRSPTDEQIFSGFFSWHPKKGENFRADELPHWLDWMRRHGIVPTGSGSKTMSQMGTLL